MLTTSFPFKSLILASAVLLAGTVQAGSPVNINVATADQLSSSLDGVGTAKAAAIVSWRDSNGPFLSAEQLTQVPGIGSSILERNLDFILLDSADTQPIE